MNHWARPSRLDRLETARNATIVAELWPEALVLEVDDRGRFAAEGGKPVPLQDPGPRQEEDILLGKHGGSVWFARPAAVTAGEPTPWRSSDPDHWDLAAAAVSMVQWHRLRPLCEACHRETVPEPGGARRHCKECGLLAFVRQDPAVIVAITDPQDRLLLGRQAVWPAGRFSVIAGFVEPGESLEQAVWREVAEEVGVHLDAVAYVSSQPWPMPRSLMLGFAATAPDSGIVVDGVEIVEADYWERDELRRMVEQGRITLPGGVSIARHMIDSWLAGTLPRPGT